MKILALDTSTEACSAALCVDGECIERFEVVKQSHTDRILPMIEEVLSEGEVAINDIDYLAFGRGPGSFTGIRIGTGVVQGIALGADLLVAEVSTLAGIAQGVYREHGHTHVMAAIDARMEEIYWGCYQLNDLGYMELDGEEVVARSNDILLPQGSSWYGAGSAWSAYGDELKQHAKGLCSDIDGACLPHAQDIAKLAISKIEQGEVVSAESVRPVYLRNQVAWKKINQQNK